MEPFLKLKPKFNIPYLILSKHLGTILILIFFATLIARMGGLAYILVLVIAYILYIIISLLYTMYRYERTVYLFFEKKLIVVRKYKREREKTILYKDMDNMYLPNYQYLRAYYQSYLQKTFHIEDILVKLKNKNIFTNQMRLESLPDIEKVVDELVHIIYNK